MKTQKPELILPGGDLERVKIAFFYGADAVYVGLDKHSLRKAEVRFGIDEIKEAIDYAHLLGKRLFVTFNIFAHNKHLKDIEKDMKTIAAFGPDAFIMADIGVIQIAKRVAPEIPIHVSTQANTTNIEDVKFWASQGVKRVVLARELTLEEIKEIHNAVPEIELEVFVHGAMCISYSGRCLMSNYFTGRAANLGECAQPCRWNYKVYSNKPLSPCHPEQSEGPTKDLDSSVPQNDEKKIAASTSSPRNDIQYFIEEQLRPGEFYPVEESESGTSIMSSKDLRLVRYLPEILDTGVIGLKIEGRNKSEYYLATAAHAYRTALDLIAAGEYDDTAKEELEAELEKLNYRDYTYGFIFGDAIAEETYPSRSPIRKWDFLGMVSDSSPCHPEPVRQAQGKLREESRKTTSKLDSSSKTQNDGNKIAASPYLKAPRNDKGYHKLYVRNKIQKNDKIEVLTPEGVFEDKIVSITDEKGKKISEISPGKTGQEALIELTKTYPEKSMLRKIYK